MKTSDYNRKQTLNLLSLKSLTKLVIVGNTFEDNYGSFNADKTHKDYDPTHIHIRADVVKSLETGTYRDLNGMQKTNFSAASFFVGVTVLHELVHYGRYNNGLPADYSIGNITNYEAGQIFEQWSFDAIQNPKSSIQNSIIYGW